MEDNMIKHLEMVEGVIERMGNNSFQLKGWAVTLVTVIGTLSQQGADKRYFALAFVPLIAFWLLDAYYLHLERKYKVLYKNIKDGQIINFELSTENIICTGKDAKRICFGSCLIAPAEGWFYGAILGVMIILAVVLKVFG